ncbi:uncharacterized protein LOC144356058 [Saccoglossus kowalevskii]
MYDKVVSIDKKINDLQDTVNFVSSFFDEYKQRMSDLGRENAHLNDRLTNTESCLKNAQSEIEDFQQYMRRNNIEISGIPELPDEDTDEIAKKIASAVGVAIQPGDIDISHRPFKKPTATMAPSIVVSFTRRSVRNKIYSAKKKLKSKTPTDIGIGNATNPIYINEHLSPTKKQLFHKANKRRKELYWKFILTFNGNIFIRKEDRTPGIVINTESDLQRFI